MEFKLSEEETAKVGRPTKYKEEYCQKIIDFFDRDYSIKESQVSKNIKDGSNDKGATYEETTNLKRVGNTLPTFERFAFEIGVHTDTLQEWCKVHDEFSVSYKRAKQIQKDMLISNSLDGLYNTTFAIFLAKNITDLRNDPHEEESKSINISITKEDADL